ncbi:glycosyl hydrolase family 25, partial [Lactiplantibacillus pentosus]
KGIEYTTGGTPRLVVDGGYITANKANVVKPVSTISNYYTTNPGQVATLKATHIYSNINLSDGMVKAVAKGTLVT